MARSRTKLKSEFKDPEAFNKFHESDKYDIRYVSVLTEKSVEIHYKHQLEDHPVSPNFNIFVACFAYSPKKEVSLDQKVKDVCLEFRCHKNQQMEYGI